MLPRLRRLLAGAVADLAPLLVFWALAPTAGLKPAIAGTVVVVILDSLWRWRVGRRFTRLYLLTSGLTLVFGGIDLLAVTPFMLSYESVITNLLICAAFVAGSRGDKPMLQEFAEQRPGAEAMPDRPEITRFFRLMTLIWAGYFFVKAGFNLVVAWTLPLVPGMALRSSVGVVSLAVLMAISVTQGKRLYFHFLRAGWLAPRAPHE